MAQQSKQTTNFGALGELARTARLVWRLLNDPRVPILPKLIIPGVVLYVLSPIDLIPDLIPIAGQLDDVAILFFGVRTFIEMCPPDIVLEHRNALMGESHARADDYVDATYRVVDDDKK
jgi:uncharacterized membrane protein YkvA (DUF1232 family)